MQRIFRPRFLSTITSFPSTASRELALPIALLCTSGWSSESASRWSPWTKRFNNEGYSCMTIDVDHTSGKLEDLESELSKQLRQSSSPFPPLLCAFGFNSLVAQAYISSHPVSGLLLVNPPLTIAEAAEERPKLALRNTAEFDYEPFFPVAILASRRRAEELEKHRLRQEYSDEVHLLVSPEEDPIGEDGFTRVKDWMDSNGM